MLVLTRKEGETIAIGNNITVTIGTVLGEKVRLGVNAPHDVPVHREEVSQRLQNPEAA